MYALEFTDVHYAYGGTHHALNGINLTVGPGEFICILGGNGSGKSTLARHMNGLLTPSQGIVRVMGRDTRDGEHAYSVRSAVGMVFQNPDDQIVASLVEDDVAFGPENLGVPLPELRDRVTRALEHVGLEGFELRETSTLSGGQKQRVAIAGALAMEPQILVLDESSALLDPRGRAELLRICHTLNDSGLAIVYITHFMEEAVEADRVVVLDAGRVALSGSPDEVLTQAGTLAALQLDVPFAAQMSLALRENGVPVGLHVREDALEDELRNVLRGSQSAQDAHQPDETATMDERPRTTLIQLENVSFAYDFSPRRKRRKGNRQATGKATVRSADDDGRWALRNISLHIREGECLGLVGHMGSGKSTLVQLAAGLLHPSEGRVLFGGADASDKKTMRSAQNLVRLVFQYPERQLFAATVFDDVAFGPRNLGLSDDIVENRVRRALVQVHLELDALRERSPFALSGGQQRRVAIAGVLAMEPQVLIMDEPTAGLDPQARTALLELIEELHDMHDLTVVIVSHRMDDLARLCNRIAVLNEGALVAEGSPYDVFSNEAALKRIGLTIPSTLRLAHALDIAADGHIPTKDELARAIARRTPTSRSVC